MVGIIQLVGAWPTVCPVFPVDPPPPLPGEKLSEPRPVSVLLQIYHVQ